MQSGPTVIATGRYGEFEGLAMDRVVLAHYAEHGDWSASLLDLVCERLRPATVIDVGANIGLFSIPIAQRTDARCICLEPEPRNHALLRANIGRHGLSGRIETHALAAYSEATRLTMTLSADNAGDHHVRGATPGVADGASDAGAQVEVEARTLDSLLQGRELPGPVLLKLDTQGCELRALRGAAASLERVDHCVVEYWPAGLRRAGDRAGELREQLLRFPYAALLNQDDTTVALAPTAELMARLAFLRDDDPGFFDLLLTRDARV